MKILLCCIGRLENQYIREYVEYYKDLGVTNICIYDNNYDGEEYFEDVIGDYVNSGFVIIKNCRNRKAYQMQAYMNCYKEYGKMYDWIMFFDCDEFLTFANPEIKNLEQALSDPRFDNFNMIHVNWMIYTDGEQLYNNTAPVLKRFTVPKEPFDLLAFNKEWTLNDFAKSIIRGNLDYLPLFLNAHTPSNVKPCCDSIGKTVDGTSRMCKYDFSNMYLRHFRSKTIEEFLNKAKRDYPDNRLILREPRYRYLLESVFFIDNNPTIEKLDYIKEKIGLDLYKKYEKQL